MTSNTFEHEVQTSEAAIAMEQWLDQLLAVLDDSLFAAAHGPAHRNALLEDIIHRNARQICHSELDRRGDLYSPTCFLLSALIRRLKLTIRSDHWKAAIENVVRLTLKLQELQPAQTLGIQLGTPASLFRDLLCESLRNRSPRNPASEQAPRSHDLAHGVALNWALRFLLAYSLEATDAPPTSAPCKDLTWIRRTTEPLLTSVEPS